MSNTTDPFSPALIEFIDKFETPNTISFWVGLMEEEAKELNEALEHTLKELADYIYVSAGLVVANSRGAEKPTKPLAYSEDVKKAFRLSNALAEFFGDDAVGASFKRVHESNMSKLAEDGSVLRREDGKVLKGPNYQPPVLSDLI